MQFVWALLIILGCAVPFLIGGGFGLHALTNYCTSNSDCTDDEGCNNKTCIDLCANTTCPEKALCDAKNHTATCWHSSGSLTDNPINNNISTPSISCNNNTDCGDTANCIGNTCTQLCSLKKCGPRQECQVKNRTATCECRPDFQRDSKNRCVNRKN